jgi:hypothetical protein
MQVLRIMMIILSDNSPFSDIGAAGFSPTQRSFNSVQLIGAGTHQVHGCAADELQSVSCKTVLRQSPTGSCHDLAAGNRQWSICCVAGNSLVCSSIASVLSLCKNRHWVQWLQSFDRALVLMMENFLLCQLVTQERLSTNRATCFKAHLATAGRVLAMDAGCGLSTHGQWRGPVTWASISHLTPLWCAVLSQLFYDIYG